jgi:hypothetical protein
MRPLIVLLSILIYSDSVWALMPIKGILLGAVHDIDQYDPFKGIRQRQSLRLDKSEMKRLKVYLSRLERAKQMQLSCGEATDKEYKYANWDQEQTAIRDFVSTLQYVGLDYTVKAIAEYAKLNQMGQEDYTKLVDNLVGSRCTKNITVYSLQLLKDNMLAAFLKEGKENIPTPSEIYRNDKLTADINTQDTRNREFKSTIDAFTAFCSWHGSTIDYRLLYPYLKNPIIMSFLIDILDGINPTIQDEYLVLERSDTSVKVACENMICRPADEIMFQKMHPMQLGSKGVVEDFEKLYCQYFSKLQKKDSKSPTIVNWQKQQTLENTILETGQFIALVTGINNLWMTQDQLGSFKPLLKQHFKQTWDHWAYRKIKNHIHDLTYEEPLSLKLVQPDIYETQKGEFKMGFNFTLGEFDNVIRTEDKISLKMVFNFHPSILHWAQREYRYALKRGQYSKEERILNMLEVNLATKLQKREKHFYSKTWTDKLPRIMAHELLRQLNTYNGKLLERPLTKKIAIEVRFNYGIFALQYLNKRFKSSVNTKALTLKK